MIPLSLYIHIPWCVQKCPYCDFNSHQQKGEIPEAAYIDHLIFDLKQDLIRHKQAIIGRKLHSIFIGGGTPSLIQPKLIQQLLHRIQSLIPFNHPIEITMEANPGSIEAERFADFAKAGVSRLSMGIQSFNDDKLQRLGRIHDSFQAQKAVSFAQTLLGKGLTSFNIDLMHGLPNQSLEESLADLKQAIAFNPPHLSWYQLTIEPNTQFGSRPPSLPDEDILWDIFEQGDQLLRASGYEQYETSAYAKPHFQCQHNLNYWRFGDYLAIGCGAHGKISYFKEGKLSQIIRFSKTKHPKGYLQGKYLFEEKKVATEERPFEFFMNRFRLLESVPKSEFQQRTGLDFSTIENPIKQALARGLITETSDYWQVSARGKLFLNELLEIFL